MVFGDTGVGSKIEVDYPLCTQNRRVDDDKMGLFYRREHAVTNSDQRIGVRFRRTAFGTVEPGPKFAANGAG